MHYLPPASALAQFSPESQALELRLARADLDRDAAQLLDDVAAHHRDDWADARTAVRLRRILRLVASHLRDRAND